MLLWRFGLHLAVTGQVYKSQHTYACGPVNAECIVECILMKGPYG